MNSDPGSGTKWHELPVPPSPRVRSVARDLWAGRVISVVGRLAVSPFGWILPFNRDAWHTEIDSGHAVPTHSLPGEGRQIQTTHAPCPDRAAQHNANAIRLSMFNVLKFFASARRKRPLAQGRGGHCCETWSTRSVGYLASYQRTSSSVLMVPLPG